MNLIYLLGGILAFSILVIVHELGHFTLAKLNGVKVEEFSIGMGPKLFSIKGKETEYLIKALPIGGYVKMLGEEDKVEDLRSFSSKSSGRKLSIIAAGPIMNFLFAIIIFSVIGSIDGFQLPIVDTVEINNPAYSVGILKGDKIIGVNDKKIKTWEDFYTQIYMANGNNLTINVLRDGESKVFNVTPVKHETENRYIVGIYPVNLTNPSLTQSISYGFTKTGSIISQIFDVFRTLFKGKMSSNDIGGPITIIKISTKVAEQGIIPLMSLAAVLSVQLAIFNIIPFPALDGGWIFILLFEIITRKKINDKKIGFINYIGFVVLMALMVVVLVKDILFPVKF